VVNNGVKGGEFLFLLFLNLSLLRVSEKLVSSGVKGVNFLFIIFLNLSLWELLRSCGEHGVKGDHSMVFSVKFWSGLLKMGI